MKVLDGTDLPQQKSLDPGETDLLLDLGEAVRNGRFLLPHDLSGQLVSIVPRPSVAGNQDCPQDHPAH
jgi:hypothetical protein